MLKVFDIFSGIAGFTIAAELSDPSLFETIAYCEINNESRKCLEKRYPGVPIFGDIRTVDVSAFVDCCGQLPDIICGGFPCQDISPAGTKKGLSGERSGLFFEVLRLCSEIRPKYILLENSANIIGINKGREFGIVLRSLAEIGYDAEWLCVSAACVGAVHKRNRVWIIAYPTENRA